MTKQEKIIEAYGEHWDLLKPTCDENGWICNGFDELPSFEPYIGEFEEHEDCFAYRLKSLQGIENNNGWISKDVQNKNFDDYFSCWAFSDMIEYATWNPIQQYFMDVEGQLIKNITHYQPIVKPQPPLY